VELLLTELLQRADEEIGRAASDVEQKLPGAEGRLAQAEIRHAELLARRDRRRTDLERQRAFAALKRVSWRAFPRGKSPWLNTGHIRSSSSGRSSRSS
jgi:hypothetical protein